jgi:prepilin-type N-terminal cleavage/methylation domain-containing protein
MRKNGFTLVELLVSVTIVAVITVVATVYYGATLRKSRDSRRMSDLEKIRIAAEVAKQSAGIYMDLPNMFSSGYLQQIPTDPKTGETYPYNRISNYSYMLCAKMEDVGNSNCTTCTNCLSCGSEGSCNYQLSNP